MSRQFKKIFIAIAPLLFLGFVGCSRPEEAEREKVRHQNAHAEYIYNSENEKIYEIKPPQSCPRQKYPWEEKY